MSLQRRPSFDIRLSSSGTAAVRAGFAVATSLALARLGVGVLFARHACRTVFSREPPDELSALASLLQVTRPLRIAWRLLTARFRTTPDVYILGEVRCGTTTLASMLRSELGMSGPFTPWVHPLADEKESFYFSGHYWGVVAPALYPLAFPLRVWRWLHRWLRGRRLFVFEGCASYLSSPWAPRLVAAVTPRPVLVVCLREPVEQHRSWWRLEQAPLQASLAWAEELRLGRRWLGPPHRTAGYPPKSFREAVLLSRSAVLSAIAAKCSELHGEGDGLADCTAAADGLRAPCKNASAPLPDDLAPDELTQFELAAYYRPHNERLFRVIGRDLGWHNDPHRYPFYHPSPGVSIAMSRDSEWGLGTTPGSGPGSRTDLSVSAASDSSLCLVDVL
ncbi:hypothetical protein EMIHUDRAFT_466989 [Emiliania huxleyi CCMP1516]|uniref:Sulfotransferase n=2 Tax=Emiliania huxleyi TaxID=2903 RepID=A0A0D3KPF4_EMIH1|nr:hypothetical protein EMIHUDRAFT_466989 [Emiliania huxleyi CCMP1516]EOD37639.1 hypothetical protein EMIHUDRAFT_466989 [Emiliania huxleyi CCMP1516]|eukprot:XP_005790068.1 hypothetical protein EMIHUDRAFT_466989 [Emiliania huxleyi CCMP1516]